MGAKLAILQNCRDVKHEVVGEKITYLFSSFMLQKEKQKKKKKQNNTNGRRPQKPLKLCF